VEQGGVEAAGKTLCRGPRPIDAGRGWPKGPEALFKKILPGAFSKGFFSPGLFPFSFNHFFFSPENSQFSFAWRALGCLGPLASGARPKGGFTKI
jgi:hypothetical protein